jgi:hypothetical protein
METVEAKYAKLAATPSDIHEHLPTLRRYAAACPDGKIAELGVRGVVSTWAMLAGLADGGAPTAHLWAVDLEPAPGIEVAAAAAKQLGIGFEFLQQDSATVNLPDMDMMFIDTWHVYAHLRSELARHAPRVRRWILLHDTETDRDAGESVRLGSDVAQQSTQSGYPVANIRQGLRRAVVEFLVANAEWDVVRQYRNNNGLTVLARRGVAPLSDVHKCPHFFPDPQKCPRCLRHKPQSCRQILWVPLLIVLVAVVLAAARR